MKTLDCNLIMPMDGNSSNLQRPQHRYPRRYININILCYICIYIYMYMVVDQNSSIPERPFFANKKITFAKLSRTPCLSFAGPMLANNTSYEDSLTTCQITPENHGSLLGSLLNMQLASRNPFSGQIFFAKFTGPPPSTCTLTFARSFA